MASASQLKKELKGMKTNLNTMKERLREIEKVNSGLLNSLDAQITLINKNIKSCRDKIESGVWGFERAFSLPIEINQKMERSSASDASISTMLYLIGQEISRCRSEVTDMETAVAVKGQEINEIEKKEAERREEEDQQNQ